MWKVTVDKDWGMRGPREHSHRYFSRKPSQSEIIVAFVEEFPRISEAWFKPQMSGKVFSVKLKLEF